MLKKKEKEKKALFNQTPESIYKNIWSPPLTEGLRAGRRGGHAVAFWRKCKKEQNLLLDKRPHSFIPTWLCENTVVSALTYSSLSDEVWIFLI